MANLLWDYFKMPQPHLRTVMLLIRHIISRLLADGGCVTAADAQV